MIFILGLRRQPDPVCILVRASRLAAEARKHRERTQRGRLANEGTKELKEARQDEKGESYM
jgi:hypothetical protein